MILTGVLLVLLNTVQNAFSEDVLGCGGFVKSHVPIDFSRVEVKLLTKNGILKDKINAAPNNGYYFVLLYDKGEYTLELEPPPGWSFTPTKVDLVVDGISDQCSQGKDINFVFNGFGITGKVESLGSDTGPADIEVELKSKTDNRKTLTGPGGAFSFTPVYPGTYSLAITQSRWKVYKNSVTVVVAEGNTELAAKTLIIQGYDVSGSVQTKKEPIKDAIIVLYSKEKSSAVEGCDKTQLNGLERDQPICFVRTNSDGLFTFGVVPNGNYYIKPYYKGQNIQYQPTMIEFSVSSASLLLDRHFEIVGFSVSGRVLKSLDGKPIPNAKILLDNREMAQTNSQGVYTLEKLNAGTYTIKVVYDGFYFDGLLTKLDPSTKQIGDLVPTYYRVCGNVLTEKALQVTFFAVDSTRLVHAETDPVNGRFCQFLHRGKHEVRVDVDPADAKIGLQFYPKEHAIEVTTDPIDNLLFSQLKATVGGQLNCINKNDCAGLTVTFRLKSDTQHMTDITASVINNSYKISDINPGIYEVTLSNSKLCWKQHKQTVNVNNVNVEVPAFQQTGYAVSFISSHDTEVKYKADGIAEKALKIAKGHSVHCLENNVPYTFQIIGCHSYENNSFVVNPEAPENEIHLNAQKHTVALRIESIKVDGVTALIRTEGTKSVKSLPYKNNGYQIELLLSPNENGNVIPQSDLLYFTPSSLTLSGSWDCIDLGTKFQGVAGIVFKGQVIPPLAGVVITVETDNFENLITETDNKGQYKFPPLDKGQSYKLVAKKESYVLAGPDDSGNFLAHKLAEIVIEVVDSADLKPLQGTLLSLSGGDSYRSNLQTNEEGKINFHSLSPGDYFLRPMMKEYSFEPNSKIIQVNEGQSVNVRLIGKRVAYSAFGHVTSLNKEPEPNIPVVALGLGNCSHFSEETTSESSGSFRIRGLQPYCAYEINIKHQELQIERSAPKSIRIESVHSDIKDLQLVIFRATSATNVLLKVHARNPEHYKGIRVKLMRESAVLHTAKLDAVLSDTTNGVLVDLPTLPTDSKTYSIQLESNLNRYDAEKKSFVANKSFVYVELDFTVRSNVAEQEIKQTSIWTLLFIFAVMVLVYNIDIVSQVLKERLGGVVGELLSSVTRKNTVNEYPMDNDDIDQIVQRINAVKRKPKPKKI